MCGIVGAFSVNNKVSDINIKELTNTLLHRGPDAEGFFMSNNNLCALGHRRLSILDLSEAANQPMTSSCGNYTIVYNGEVYNFQDIKKEILQFKNISFKTSCDTEVLVEAFALWGKAFVYKLNGMFSIAVYDKRHQVLWLFRDRLGIKPLYYFWNHKFFVFASELKALKKIVPYFGKFTFNIEAFNHFLRFGYVREPLTIFNEVKKFKSAHYAAINLHGINETCYWNIEKKVAKNYVVDKTQAKQKLKNIIESSVKMRMISDVPFGTLLSGGVDSSLVTAIAQKNSNKCINTFSIAFKESKFNEAKYAQKVAKALKTNHNEFTVSIDDAKQTFEHLTSTYDEPFADSSAIPTMLVSKLARTKVKMTLSGDGGDEQFFGYGMYNWANRLKNPFLHSFRKPLKTILSQSKKNRNKRVAQMFNYKENNELKDHIFSVEQYFFSDKDLHSILRPQLYRKIKAQRYKTDRTLTYKEEQALYDIDNYLKDDLLVKVDRASMNFSLENRVPLLDHRVIEFSLNVHPKLKFQKKESKYLLKQVLYEYLPPSLFDRPKWGFALPIELWLSTDFKYILDKYVNPHILDKYHMFVDEEILKIKSKYLSGESYLFNKLWQVIILHQWFEQNEPYLKEISFSHTELLEKE